MIFNEENINILLQKVKGSRSSTDFPFNYWALLKKELQVHTKGKLYEKVVSVYSNEDPHATKFVINTYEPITRSSIWKGIDNISRIFKYTGFNKNTSDAETLYFLQESGIENRIIENFINKTTAEDPNTVAIPYFKDGSWTMEFLSSDLIDGIEEDSIIVLDPFKNKYQTKTEVKLDKHDQRNELNKNNELLKTIVKEYERKHFIYITKTQYIEIELQSKKAITNIIPFEKEVKPYIFTGVNQLSNYVFESPVQQFVPFGNIALLKHRMARCVENLFGYPRMSEIELPCDNCTDGQMRCDDLDECPTGIKECTKCHGTGSLSLQSIFKIYKRKLSAEHPELNVNIDPVQFHTPDVAILQHISKDWEYSLKMGEDSIYVPQVVETGNVQSAKSREKILEQMYSWLDRISKQFYTSAEDIMNNLCILNGHSNITIEKPISFAIMSELESFEYLNMIVNSESPIFIKTTHIDNFLKKYISSSNPVIRLVELLKKIDMFCFYSNKDLKDLSNNGIIEDKDWKVHAYAYPILSKMVTLNSELLQKTDEELIKLVDAELSKYMPKELSLENINGGGVTS